MSNIEYFLKSKLFRFVPANMKLPLRYHYRKYKGSLDYEMSVLNNFVRKNSTVIDVGANFGVYTYLLAKYCKTLHAFEPNPRCAAEIEACSLPNVEIHKVGLSSTPGEMTLHIPFLGGELDTGGGSLVNSFDNETMLDVSVMTLDQFNFKDVSFIKIDVEGYELAVLNGAEKTLKEQHPTILVEIEQRHHEQSIVEVFQTIEEMGYKGYFYYQEKPMPLSQFVLEKHQPRLSGHEPPPNYVHNFIFSFETLT